MNLQNSQQQQLVSVNIHQLQDKCRSKKELYQFLTQDCKAFLPRIQSTNIYFLKQIIRNEKEYVSRDAVRVSSVPHIEGLTVEDFIDYAQQNPQLLRYLPDQRDWLHMDRQWVCDLLYTLEKEKIQMKINEALQKRKEKLEANRGLLIEMRPEFAQALAHCLNFSHENGRASNLLKGSSKRKRMRNEIEDVKDEEIELKQDKHMFLQKVKRLKQERELLEEQVIQLNQENSQYAQILGNEEQQIHQQEFQI